MGKVHVGDLLCDGHKLWYRVGCGSGMPGPYGVAVGQVGGIGKVRGRHVRPAPTRWWGICERYRLGNTYKALQDPYRFPLDVTCGMVYTIGIRTVLFYYILYQLISDSVT